MYTCIYYIKYTLYTYVYTGMGFHGGSDGKESACNVGDLGSIPGLGRSSGERKEVSSELKSFWY